MEVFEISLRFASNKLLNNRSLVNVCGWDHRLS